MLSEWEWPQYTIIFWFMAALLLASNQHGKLKQGHHSFWSILVGISLNLFVLIKGGFF